MIKVVRKIRKTRFESYCIDPGSEAESEVDWNLKIEEFNPREEELVINLQSNHGLKTFYNFYLFNNFFSVPYTLFFVVTFCIGFLLKFLYEMSHYLIFLYFSFTILSLICSLYFLLRKFLCLLPSNFRNLLNILIA